MSFGTNLQFLRKKQEMTQEALAEKLDVSRQTISKWESDGAYPEMEKLIALCDLFSCKMDALLREDMTAECKKSVVSLPEPDADTVKTDIAYDPHMNRHARITAIGVGLILLDYPFLQLLLLLLKRIPYASYLALGIAAAILIVAVIMLIIEGITHKCFLEEHPNVGNPYDKEEINRFNSIFSVLVAGGTALILIGFLTAVLITLKTYNWVSAALGIFPCFLGIAVPILIWAGMQKRKYKICAYNQSREKKTYGGTAAIFSAILMLFTLGVYLLMGLFAALWRSGLVIFPFAIIICVVMILVFPEDKNTKQNRP